MQYAPSLLVEGFLIAAAGTVSVRITVRNVGRQRLDIKSGESALELADGRRLVLDRTPRPPEETTTSTVPQTTTVDAPASKGSFLRFLDRPVTTTADKVGVGIVAGIVAVTFVVLTPLIAIAGIVTSPIWGPVVLVSAHQRRAEQQRAIDARLASGDVVLAGDESASAILQFVDDGVDTARIDTAFLILPVTDTGAERDWTARIPLSR